MKEVTDAIYQVVFFLGGVLLLGMTVATLVLMSIILTVAFRRLMNGTMGDF